MNRHAFRHILTLALSLMIATPLSAPAIALAKEGEAEVDLENHVAEGTVSVSDIFIDKVEVPETGKKLDDKASVKTAEDKEWDVPVLWVRDDLQLATEAEEERTYLPVIAFFVPEGLTVDGGNYTVTLSESLTKLFGDNKIISVYDSSTGITYILPASLRDLFVRARQEAAATPCTDQASAETNEPTGAGGETLVDIYCSKTARDAFDDEDLQWLLELILDKLQPQAVELLLDSFPAFRTAAEKGQIGKEIGLYVYYSKGDDDGLPEHSGAPQNALAYVSGDAIERDGAVKYCYMIGIDTSSLAETDDNGNPIHKSTTGSLVLARDGSAMRTFENTIVHELFHALMDDYNRTGMMGGTDPVDVLTDEQGHFASEELAQRYIDTRFPQWFIEGTASAVENNYQFRYKVFQEFRADGEGGYNDKYTTLAILNNYINGTVNGKDAYFDLIFSSGFDGNGNRVETSYNRYVTGYLADLYLSELAARSNGASAIEETEESLTIYSDRLRMGLNTILERLHSGDTLDQVVKDLAPTTDDGKKIYEDTADFESKFVKGVPDADDVYYGDPESVSFVNTFLNYMLLLEKQEDRRFVPNGSILFSFGEDYLTPLDNEKDSTSDYLQIKGSNQFVESTVPNSEALIGGGKSITGAVAKAPDSSTVLQPTADPETVIEEAVVEDAGLELVTEPLPEDVEATAEQVEVVPEEVMSEEVEAEELPVNEEDLALAAKAN